MPVLARLLLALCAVVLLSPGPIRAQSEEWTVYTSVVDQNGTPVIGLTAADFVVRENGVAREILRVSPATDSLQVAVLLDNSQEIRNDLIDLRRVMVVITTQGPEFSEIGYQTVLEYVRDSGAPMHSFVLRREGVSPTDPAAQEVELTLAVGTRMTGGRREDLLTSMGMTSRFQSLAAELNNQYQVVYARPRTLVPPKTIDVGVVKRPDVIVRAPRVL